MGQGMYMDILTALAFMPEGSFVSEWRSVKDVEPRVAARLVHWRPAALVILSPTTSMLKAPVLGSVFCVELVT